MKNTLRQVFCVCLLATLICATAFAQGKKTASGVVISAEDNEPIIGAAVTVKGRTGIGTATDIDGNFHLDVPADVTTLVVSYIGMESQEIPVAQHQRIVLQSSNQQLEEVEVVSTGVGQQDKRLFTGASQKIMAAETQLAGMSDVSRSLEGRLSGVQVTNVSGTFGAAPKIRVRGATSIYGNSKPLWVIDGVIYEDNVDVTAEELSSGDVKTLVSSAVAGLNADDIESLTVLKDGSATSIYGARAMAGVVVVTTKKSAGGSSHLNYTGEFSTRLKPSYRNFNIMNSQEIMSVYRELEGKGWFGIENLVNAENSGIYGKMYQLIRSYENGEFGLENTTSAKNAYLQAAEFRNTDWFDELFSNAVAQTHSVSISSGSDKSKSYVSASVMNDPGWYKRSEVQRYTFNGNVSYDIMPNLTVKLASIDSHRRQEAPGTLDQTVDVVTGEVKRGFDINPFSYALNTARCLDPDETYTRFYSDFNIFDELRNNYNEFEVNDLMFRGELQWKALRTKNHSIELNGLIAARYQHTKLVHNVKDKSNLANAYRAGIESGRDPNSTVQDENSFLYTDPDGDSGLPESVLPKGGIKYQTDYNLRSNDYRATMQYRGLIGDNNIVNVFVGSELETYKQTTSKWTGWGYQYENGGDVFSPYQWLKQLNEENSDYFGESFMRTNSLAFYGTATYSYAQRYILNGTLRYEGTNRLGKSHQSRWLPTWNISGSWNVDSEAWFQNQSLLSAMNFRLSYSLTADTGPSDVTNAQVIYMTHNAWRPTTSAAESAIYISSLANDELTYEKKHELNVGTDFSLLENRVAVTFDAYWRDNFDLIGLTNTQGVGGQISKMANVADMESNGVEIGVSVVPVKTKNFKWTTDVNYTHVKNEITDLNTSCTAVNLVTNMGYPMEGYPVRSLFSYRFGGLNEEGLPLVYNENGVLTVGDIDMQASSNLTDFLHYEGSTDPTFYGSWSNTFAYDAKWGGLSLDVYLTYSGGNVVRLNPVFSSEYNDLVNLPREFKNRWMVPGDEAKTDVPVLVSREQRERYGAAVLRTAYQAYNYSDVRVANGDFVRLKEVAVGYSAPRGFVEKCHLSNLGLKLSATNICLLYADKKLNGQDPEFFNAGGVASPMPKQFTATLKVGF
ncbi:MAG: SusC/RagA family TonB-linked outer membrane protein [Bacteroidales bacterium]|nr:SusC/RagA family TonB-linked outer membrane protein [Bacteroidales bacterium]